MRSFFKCIDIGIASSSFAYALADWLHCYTITKSVHELLHPNICITVSTTWDKPEHSHALCLLGLCGLSTEECSGHRTREAEEEVTPGCVLG